MRTLLAALLLVSCTSAQLPAPSPSDIEGAWLGALDVMSMKLRLVFHVATSADGLTATMDSLDQNAKGIPVSKVVRNGATIVFEMPNIGGRFEGQIDKDVANIVGTWSQAGSSFPLTLTRVKDESALQVRRPQEPKRPYPYRDEDVSYRNVAAGITLAATLTIPAGKGPFPAALLVTGSGPQDRDEAIMGHKPFLVLADYLTRHGIAVLRADDRGFGKSSGTFATATSADFATDVEAGIAYLRARNEVDPRKIGLIGHSEGGIIAPMVAARDHDIGFVVLLAGTGVPGDKVLVEQVRMINAASGLTADKLAQATALHREILDLFISEKDDAVFAQKLRDRMSGKVPDVQINMAIAQRQGPWGRYFVTYDPGTALRNVRCPVLALIGDKDTQVSAAQNLPAIRAALAAGGNKDYDVAELPGLNHLFQSAETGSPAEYGQIEETMSPVALDRIASWIAARELAAHSKKQP